MWNIKFFEENFPSYHGNKLSHFSETWLQAKSVRKMLLIVTHTLNFPSCLSAAPYFEVDLKIQRKLLHFQGLLVVMLLEKCPFSHYFTIKKSIWMPNGIWKIRHISFNFSQLMKKTLICDKIGCFYLILTRFFTSNPAFFQLPL